MLLQHTNVMVLLRSTGEIIGRKKFQKIIYISKKLGLPFQERYDFHIYGPYSEELSLRLEELHHLGFLNEVKEEKTGYFQYRYTLAPEGERFLTQQKLIWSCEKEKEMVDDMNACSSKFLELIATVLYLEPAPKTEVVEKVHRLKRTQNYSLEDIDRAYASIEKWRMRV